MSVFRVNLSNTEQGRLDLNASVTSNADERHNPGAPFDPSIQRGVWIMGPNRINRLLLDGATFTDCNYWKRFAYPLVSLENAIVEVVTDDGSVYSDIPEENVFPVVGTFVLAAGYTAPNTVDFVGTYGGPATFVQIKVTGATATIQLNGSATSEFTLTAGSTQIFDDGDLVITKLAFKGAAATVDLISGVRSRCNS